MIQCPYHQIRIAPVPEREAAHVRGALVIAEVPHRGGPMLLDDPAVERLPELWRGIDEPSAAKDNHLVPDAIWQMQFTFVRASAPLPSAVAGMPSVTVAPTMIGLAPRSVIAGGNHCCGWSGVLSGSERHGRTRRRFDRDAIVPHAGLGAPTGLLHLPVLESLELDDFRSGRTTRWPRCSAGLARLLSTRGRAGGHAD
jgi:hypothetical protein